MEKKKQEQDRHLQTPAEANRDKHINFRAIESGDNDRADEDTTNIYGPDNSRLQTPEEEEMDKKRSVTENDDITVTNTDLRETNADRIAGTDRAGTSERK